MMIAIDGPAASGKGTLSRKLAEHFMLKHLDTGLLYRGVAALMLEQKLDLKSEDLALSMAKKMNVQSLEARKLSREDIGDAASKIAAFNSVREALLSIQRHFAEEGTQEGRGNVRGAILDGRDIGTVVLPNADIKFFITASPEIRAQRRFKQEKEYNKQASFEIILNDIYRRDERDRARTHAPLKVAADAITLDTTSMKSESVFQRALEHIEKRKH